VVVRYFLTDKMRVLPMQRLIPSFVIRVTQMIWAKPGECRNTDSSDFAFMVPIGGKSVRCHRSTFAGRRCDVVFMFSFTWLSFRTGWVSNRSFSYRDSR
jgi:hypothetical protein